MNDNNPAASGAAPAAHEHDKAIQEGKRIGASDAYFAARHNMLDTRDRRNVFDAGFDRGYVAALASPQVDPAPKPLDDPKLQQWFGDAIEGAMAFGFMGNNPPPEGHWLTRFWNIGRAEATKAAQPASPAPLTYDQIDTVYRKIWASFPSTTRLIRFAHAIYALASPQVAPAPVNEFEPRFQSRCDAARPINLQGLDGRRISGKEHMNLQSVNLAAPVQVAPQDDARDAAGIERAARYVEKLADGYADEHGRYDHETGATEFSDAGLEYHSTLCELAEGIRALANPAAKTTEPTLPNQREQSHD